MVRIHRRNAHAQFQTDAPPFSCDDGGLDGRPRNAACQPLAGGRQALDRLLGPLGAGRQQRVDQALIEEWAAKNKVEVSIDYIPSQGNKLLLTIAAEAQARSGHDILALSTWQPAEHARNLEPVDDVMAELIKQNGAVNQTVEYLGRADGKWIAVPATVGSQIKGPCSRIDLMKQHAGIDIQAMYPAGSAPKADAWTLDAFLKAAEACHKAGHPFGIGLGTTSDNGRHRRRHLPCLRRATGRRQGQHHGQVRHGAPSARLLHQAGEVLPAGCAGLGRCVEQQVAGLRQRRADHESAERLGGRQARRAAGRRAVLDARLPVRVRRAASRRSCRTSGASGTSARTSRPPRACWCTCRSRRRSRRWWRRARGYDLPSFANLTTFKTWAEEGPPKGTLYHYPNPHNHQILSVAAAPAPPKIAVQIYTQGIMTKMTVRHLQGEAMEKTLAWAESEVEGFMRT